MSFNRKPLSSNALTARWIVRRAPNSSTEPPFFSFGNTICAQERHHASSSLPMLRSERDHPLIGLPRRLNAALPSWAGDLPSRAEF